MSTTTKTMSRRRAIIIAFCQFPDIYQCESSEVAILATRICGQPIAAEYTSTIRSQLARSAKGTSRDKIVKYATESGIDPRTIASPLIQNNAVPDNDFAFRNCIPRVAAEWLALYRDLVSQSPPIDPDACVARIDYDRISLLAMTILRKAIPTHPPIGKSQTILTFKRWRARCTTITINKLKESLLNTTIIGTDLHAIDIEKYKPGPAKYKKKKEANTTATDGAPIATAAPVPVSHPPETPLTAAAKLLRITDRQQAIDAINTVADLMRVLKEAP